MYTIYWMNQHNQDWTDDVIYISKKQAVEVLEKQGYMLNAGWYTREQVGWEGRTRALVSGMSIYGLKGNKKEKQVNWKTKLGLTESVRDREVVRYLKALGFEEGIFMPQYSEKGLEKFNLKTIGSPCLCLTSKEPFSDAYYTIFVNDNEMYVEKETDEFESSNYIKIDEDLTIKNVDKYLNKII